MEPVSLTLGIISFIHETIHIVEELKTRWQTTNENSTIIEDLLTTYSDLGSYLGEIEKKFGNKRRLFSKKEANKFRNDINQIKENCKTSVGNLTKIKHYKFIKQTVKAMSTNKKLTEMLSTATQDKELARFWNTELHRVSRWKLFLAWVIRR